MTTLRIVTVRDEDAGVLRQKARPVRRIDRELRQTLEDMVDTMRDAPGVGLAAPGAWGASSARRVRVKATMPARQVQGW